MIGDIRKHLEFTIDHIYLPPEMGRVVVSDAEGVVIVLPAVLMSGLTYSISESLAS